MVMERLDFGGSMQYNAMEASIHLNRYLAAKPYINGMNVLDAACGEGYGSNLMKKWGAKSVVGMDCSEDAIALARKNFQEDTIEFVKHSVEQLPFADNSFDVVVSLETIEHLEHPEAFLTEIKRVLKADGTIIMSCPNDHYYEVSLDGFENLYHKRRHTFAEFKKFAENILGEANNWYMGMAVDGFMNIPLVAEGGKESVASGSMRELMHYKELAHAMQVPADECLVAEKSCYYLGIWGAEKHPEEVTAGIFAKELFQNPKEASICSEMSKRISALEKQLAQAEREAYSNHIEIERARHLWNLAEKEKVFLWKRIDHYQQQVGQLEADSNYLHFLQGSKAYKLIMKYWRFKDKLKRLVRK